MPSIEYLRGDGYRAVPDAAVVSDGPVRSVALFTPVPVDRITSIALDTSSRTSVALLRVLCARRFGLAPRFIERRARHRRHARRWRTRRSSSAIPRSCSITRRAGLLKVDLGAEWKALTGLPFVYAFWTGRPGVLTTADVSVLQQARADGEADPEGVARLFFPGDAAAQRIGAEYLRANIQFRMGEREVAGAGAVLRARGGGRRVGSRPGG